jgi:hypothetical protein
MVDVLFELLQMNKELVWTFFAKRSEEWKYRGHFLKQHSQCHCYFVVQFAVCSSNVKVEAAGAGAGAGWIPKVCRRGGEVVLKKVQLLVQNKQK